MSNLGYLADRANERTLAPGATGTTCRARGRA